MRLSADKLTGILRCQRTQVNKKMTKNGKKITFVVFGHPELVEGPLIQFLAALPSAMSSGRMEPCRAGLKKSVFYVFSETTESAVS